MNEPTQALQPLTLSPKAESVVQPKPTKREIIDALVELRLEQVRKTNRDNQERRNKLSDRIRPALVRYCRDNALKIKPTISLGYKSNACQPHAMEVGFKPSFSELPAELQAQLNEYHDIKDESYGSSTFDAKKRIRREIEAAMQNKQPTEERVQALLTNKASRASLETILDNLTGKTIPAVTDAKPQ